MGIYFASKCREYNPSFFGILMALKQSASIQQPKGRSMTESNETNVTPESTSVVTTIHQASPDFSGPLRASNHNTSVTTVNEDRELELALNMTGAGVLPEQVMLVGESDTGFERFQVAGDDDGQKSGWLARNYNEDGVLVAATYGNWKISDKQYGWRFDGFSALPVDEQKAIEESVRIARITAQEHKEKEQKESREVLAKRYDSLALASDHPYLTKKGISVTEGVKVRGSELMIPLHDVNGNLLTAQYIGVDGNKRLAKGCGKKGAFYKIQGDDTVILIAEGYATAVTLNEATGYTTLMAIDCGNLIHVARALRGSKSAIVICGDNDQFTDGNPGTTKAKEAAKASDAVCVFPAFSRLDTRPTDFNDLATLEGVNEVKNQVEMVVELALLRIPAEYEVSNKGVYLKKKDDTRERLCSPLKVLAMTRDRNSKNWGKYIELTDADGVNHKFAVPAELINEPKALLGLLTQYGLSGSINKQNDIATYINLCKPVRRAICTDKVGWKDKSFILPDGMIGESNEAIVVQARGELQDIFEKNGTLEDWKTKVAALCSGNSRMILAVSMAFASPLLHLIGEESGGVHLRCGSSRGKTTSLRLAKSVWGNPTTIQVWRATDNGLESLASLHNNTLLCMDELGQLDPKKAGDAIYMLGNGKGKQRADSSAEARSVKTWNLLFLSTGELSLQEVMKKTGDTTYAGQEVRFIDLPADAGAGFGIFDHIHEYPSSAEFANDVNRNSNNYFGTAGKAFLRFIANNYDSAEVTAKKLVEDFVKNLDIEASDPQVKRVARKFGVIYAGGCLATRSKITGWDVEDVFNSIKQCFTEWLEERGGDGSLEEARTLEEVKKRLRRSSNMFGDRDSALPSAMNQGRESWGHYFDGFYHVFVPAFKEELCKDLPISQVIDVLDKGGFLQKGSKHPTRSQRLMGKTTKVYSISEKILEEALDEDDVVDDETTSTEEDE